MINVKQKKQAIGTEIDQDMLEKMRLDSRHLNQPENANDISTDDLTSANITIVK